MPPTHISGTSRALYRVFIAPTLRSTTSVPLLYAPAFAPPIPTPASLIVSTPSLASRTSIRAKKYTKETRRPALDEHFVMDSAIQAENINLVDQHGEFHKSVPLNEALTNFDRTTHCLVEVNPGKVDELGRPDPENPPTCRVMSKMELRDQHERKLDLMRQQQQQSKGRSAKMLELNWAIALGDLKHRLENMKRFLKQGKKVEVVLGPKKGGRKATPEEAEEVVKAIRDAAAECNGTVETKKEGEVGALMTLFFHGKFTGKTMDKADKEDEKAQTQTAKETTEDKGA